MKRIQLVSITIKVAVFCMLLSTINGVAKADNPPFTVKPGLFDQAQPDNLGLTIAEGTETVTVFQPDN
ncbi:MAG: hypothetical protein JXK95_16755 [Bacteroidales bacterium]|nr:hypothetical protein [Bacteroidales bacterium]